MRRGIAIGATLFVLAAIAAYAFREPLTLAYLGAKTEKRTLTEQTALIAPFVHIFAPETGAPPYPVVLQFHGCAGYRQEFMEMWAKEATREGYLVIAVDSGAPRGIDRERSYRTVCAGKELIGQERAGDVAAALELARSRADVDPRRIVIAGWSHGGWSVMDFLALDTNGRWPPSLSGPAHEAEPAGVVLFYPYCGEGSWSRILQWRMKTPVLAFIAGADSIVDGPQCRSLLERFKGSDSEIDVVYYPDADHVFDDATLEGENKRYYSPEDAADARRRYAAFLEKISRQPAAASARTAAPR